MLMDKIAASKNDEFYTPYYAVEPILKPLWKRGFRKIWCPFDKKESWFVQALRNGGFDVIHSHIEDGQDFFKATTPDCDAIVSNPPYSLKGCILENLFGRGVSFAMLVGVVGLFESEKRFTMFESNNFEILYLNRRVSYFKNYGDQKPSVNPPFSSVYICSGVLPKQICFSRINKALIL